MRRGDVCKLHWGDVDFAEGVVTAKASKTGETVEVPIFRPLRDVLESRLDNGSEYVFPEAARILQENTDSLTWRFKKIIVKALSPDSDQETDVVCPVEIEPKGKAAIVKSIAPGARRDRILDSFKRLCYCEGASIREIVTATGRAHRTTAGDLAVVEKVTGARFVRRPARSVKHRGP